MTDRQKITFQSNGVDCAGLYFPSQKGGAEYSIVMAHGLAAIKEMRLDAYAETFAAAGFNVFIFDYRHFGESGGTPRQLLDLKKQHQDWHAAINFVKDLITIDDTKIILWGSSLSGGHVMALASQLPSIKAVISQVPHVSAKASASMLPARTTRKLAMAAVRDKIGSLFGLRPHYVNASGQPGEVAIMTGAGESEGYLKLVPEGMAFDQRVAARYLIQAGRYSPGKNLKSLAMPTLVQVGLQDKTTPAQAVIDDCKDAKSVELKTYELGHFEPYIDPDFPAFVKDQVAFLQRVTKAN